MTNKTFMSMVSDYGLNPTQEGFDAIYTRYLADCRAATSPAGVVKPLQSRVQPWMMACFGPEISADKLERSDRFIEEALELVQSGDYPKERVLALVDYVYGREKGEMTQEVGGVMITLAAFCLAHDIDMHEAGETELARIWTKVEKIRAKQAAKPTGSALPVSARIMSAIEPAGVGVETPPPQAHVAVNERLMEALKTSFCALFLDGRNEHGAHVLPSYPRSFEVVDDDVTGQAEAILEAAENAGFQIGHHVWAEFAWIAPQVGDEGRVELDGYWDFRWINEEMTRAAFPATEGKDNG